jgi:hypothetical protein
MNWKGTRDPIKESLWTDHAKNDREQLVVAKFMGTRTEIQEHRNLFIDAVHTIQICDRLPSELLKENTELVAIQNIFTAGRNKLLDEREDLIKSLNNLIAAAGKKTPIVHIPEDEYLYTAIHKAKDLINKIENGQ